MADDERSSEEPKMPGTVRKGAPGTVAGASDPPKSGEPEGTGKKSVPVSSSKESATEPTRREPESGTAPAPASAESDQVPDPLRGSRTSGLWIGLIFLGILLVLLVIFITQNTQEAEVNYLGWQGRAPQAALLLAAAVAGLFLTVIAGSLRILQLRRRVRKVTKAQKKQAKRQAKQQAQK